MNHNKRSSHGIRSETTELKFQLCSLWWPIFAVLSTQYQRPLRPPWDQGPVINLSVKNKQCWKSETKLPENPWTHRHRHTHTHTHTHTQIQALTRDQCQAGISYFSNKAQGNTKPAGIKLHSIVFNGEFWAQDEKTITADILWLCIAFSI